MYDLLFRGSPFDRRTTLGLFFAPLVGGFVFMCALQVFALFVRGVPEAIALDPRSLAWAAVSIFLLALVGALMGWLIALFGMLFVGVPTLLILRWAGWERWYTYACSGGLGAGLLFPPVKGVGYEATLFNAAAGAIILCTFYLLGRRRARQSSGRS